MTLPSDDLRAGFAGDAADRLITGQGEPDGPFLRAFDLGALFAPIAVDVLVRGQNASCDSVE